jgi:hypothetical protein
VAFQRTVVPLRDQTLGPRLSKSLSYYNSFESIVSRSGTKSAGVKLPNPNAILGGEVKLIRLLDGEGGILRIEIADRERAILGGRVTIFAGCSGDVDRIMVDAGDKSGERGCCGEERADQQCAEHSFTCVVLR